MLEFVTHAAPHDVIFIHGAGGTNQLWSRTMHRLSGEARALAVNLPGHPSGDISCRSVGEYADAVRGFIVESGLSGPVICGHSMGGAVVLEVAVKHPELVGGLILVSTGAKLGVDQKILDGLNSDPMKTIEGVITRWSFFSSEIGTGPEARAALSIPNLPVFLNDYLSCQGFDIRSDLANIRARTLVVCGDRDRMTPPRWSHYLAASIPDSESFFIRDSGHMIPLEKPDALSIVLQNFLKSLPS